MAVRVEPLTGDRIKAALPDIARLRIEVFREWPYLYDGTYAYEHDYFARFADSDGAFVAAVIDGDRIVGAATATRMGGHADGFEKPFVEAGYDISRIFYFGESVLLRAYRGRGLGNQFFDERERHARTFSGIERAAFCSVIRPADHPQKPPEYRALDGFWTKRGYRPLPDVIGAFSWQDIGSDHETEKPMQYWIKDF
ncbi:MAG: GNAT family N-acetyltransferase [Hyphomicrobiaceae bacterium]